MKYGKNAKVIGKVIDKAIGEVGLRTAIGGIRIVDMPQGEQNSTYLLIFYHKKNVLSIKR